MAAPAPPRPFRAAGPTEAWRVLALGGNVWAVTLLLPVLHGGMRDGIDFVTALMPLVPLAAGAALIAEGIRPLRRAVAIGLLLFVFPVALALAQAHRVDLVEREAWGTVGLFAGALSLLAYGAVATEACSRPLALRTSSAQALPAPTGGLEPMFRTWLRRLVLGGAALGALAAAVIAPTMGSRAALLRTWGDAADEALVLGCVLAAGAGALGIAAMLGPCLRALRPGEAPRSGGRIAFELVLASLALLAYAALRWLDAS